ncbi:MAG: hypothetical protein LBV00_10235, partial [Propionibacteriaceae bacterium]|nr:hypothetical protein [Propionibacteriaceae bacterium]
TVQVCDSVWVDHTDPDDLWLNQWGTNTPVEVTVTGKLHHSAVPAQETTRLDHGVPVVDDYELTFTAAGQDHAQQVCHTIGAGGYGAYGFQWTIDLDDQPAPTREFLSDGTVTPLWLPVETTMVRTTPVIHTAATKWETTKNGQTEIYFQDDLWATGWPDSPAESEMHGAVGHGDWPGLAEWSPDIKTLTVELWRIEGDVTPDSCTADNPAARLVAMNTLVPAQNTWATAQKVSGSRFKADGGEATYTFVVSSPGDARTEPFRTLCGEVTETITITPTPPSFATQLVTPADLETSNVETAHAQETGITVEPGAELVDVLHAWHPDETGAKADMTGWQATWDVYHVPADDTAVTPRIVETEDGRRVYEGAVCTPATLVTTMSEPVLVEQTGMFASPVFTAPQTAGMLFVVETITNTSNPDEPLVVHRGECGLVSESAVIQTEPTPLITTKAPQHATVGNIVTDEAILTGPYQRGDQIDFWYQTGEFLNPNAASDELACAAPHPHDMTGATHIGSVTLDRDVPVGEVVTLTSPEFTSDTPGCTFIKEIATRPDTDGGEPVVLAQGWFGAADETTIWTPPITAETGGSILPTTGTTAAWWLLPAGVGLAGAGVGIVLYVRHRHTSR